MERTAAGYFRDAEAADAAINALVERGYDRDRIDRAQYFADPVPQGGFLVTIHTDEDHYDAASALLAEHGAIIRAPGPVQSGTTAPHDPGPPGARPEDTVTAAPGTNYPDARSSDAPPGDEMPVSYAERQEYLGAVEDVVRTAETHDPDDLKQI